ncbi:MAG: hypothetical protein R2848_01875 [Thermomicrobiales bacterium]
MATADAAQRPSSAVGSQYDPDAYDICRPTIPIPENETDSEKIDRMQREFEALRDCVNAELKVRPETSLLGLILLKVVLPFAAIAAGFTAIYAGALRAGNADKGHTELFFGIGYAILVAGAVMLLRSLRKPGAGGHGDSISTSMRNALKLTVPPSKEKLTRNKLVNNWIFFWLTWGLIIGLPVIFFLFRSDALDRAGLHLTFDTANVCAPTADGFNPYEGSDVCDNRGYTYVDSKDVATSTTTGVGSDEGVESLQVAPSRTAEEFNTAEVRMDVTTTLVLYFLILIVGILVNMVRWWRKDKQRLAAQDAPA